ncbi:uncharacterized protein Dwil_GK16762 [Drosophila willistoni]|uniref:Phosphatidic acid phosphatase type 2/haloperoxidase domain-containing protein n=1 Tax=Drosophila willistoni TaxID=7260 RepID=B4MMA3_DROWI|nr:putative phosphatidate phosphatase [Drosophila willistoni]EDW73248.2 uncharacterized protein Dwil_GK16762 [Drosophila willistoni]
MRYIQQLQGSAVRLFVDVILLGILLIFTENFTKVWWPTTQRGFFCNDESLKYPYHEDTVSPTLLHWLGLYGPLFALLLIEVCLMNWQRASSQWQEYFNLYNTLRWFLYGYASSDIIKNVAKQTIGRLRPHFFAVCGPLLIPEGGTCLDEATDRGIYHTSYTCQPEITGATAHMLKDIHVSFPSGHSMLSFYGLVFLALHLQHRHWPLRGSLLSPALQLLCLCIASFVALSRVMDYKHHGSDVAAGSLLGASVAFVVSHAAKLEEQIQLKAGGPSKQSHGKGQEPEQSPTVPVAEVSGVGEKHQQLPSHDLSLVTCCSAN